MDHWTYLPSEDHWKSVSFTFTAIYTSCRLVFWDKCTHQVFGSLNTLLSWSFQDFPPDYSIIILWNIKKNPYFLCESSTVSRECMGQTIFVRNPKREWKRKRAKWEEKPVAPNCFVAVKTKKFTTVKRTKDAFWFSYRSVLLKDFQLNIQIKSIQ